MTGPLKVEFESETSPTKIKRVSLKTALLLLLRVEGVISIIKLCSQFCKSYIL